MRLKLGIALLFTLLPACLTAQQGLFPGNTSASLPVASGAGLALLSTGAGSAYTAQSVILPNTNANQTINSGCGLFCQFQVGAMNNEFNLAGFPSTCTTNEGNFGMQLECAWYLIYDYSVLATARPVLNLGYGNFNIAHSLVEPTKTFTGISLHGVGKQSSNIVVNAQLTDAAIYKNETDVAGTLPSLSFTGFKISATNNSFLAGGCMRIWGVQELVREHINCINVPGGATGNAPFYYQIGEPSNYGQGWVFQQSALDVIAGAKPTQPNTPATITPSAPGGNLTLAITNGGAGYSTSTTQIPYLVLMGNQGGTSDQPCSVMPSAISIGLTGSAVSTLTFSGGTGCSGTIEARIVEIPNIPIGYDEWSTDSDLHDYVPVGAIIGITVHGGNTRVYGAHPTVTIIGIQNVGNDVFFGPYMDTTYQWGMDFEQASPYANPATIFGAQGYNNAPNFAVFHTNSTSIPKFHGMNALCANTTPGDFHEFLGPTGTVEHSGWSVLNGGEVLGNDTTCPAITLGDYVPKLAIDSLTVNSCSGPGCGTGSSTPNTQFGVCVGTFTSSVANGTLQSLGAGSSGACSGSTTGNGNVMTQAGTLSNLSVRCLTGGVNSSSGVFTLFDAPSGTAYTSATNTGIAVTYGTGPGNTTKFDNTHTFTYAKGDMILINISTQASETLATCSASYNY